MKRKVLKKRRHADTTRSGKPRLKLEPKPNVPLIESHPLPVKTLSVTEAQFTDVCERVEMGRTLRTACDQVGVSPLTVRRMAGRDEQHMQQYARAKFLMLDAWSDELVDIADDGRNDWMEHFAHGHRFLNLDKEAVERSKIRIAARQWLLSKLRPDQYGEKLQLAIKDNLGDKLKAARERARARIVSDQ